MDSFEQGRQSGDLAVRRFHWEPGAFASPEEYASWLKDGIEEELANIADLYERDKEVAQRHEEYFKGYLVGVDEGLASIRETNERGKRILGSLRFPPHLSGENK